MEFDIGAAELTGDENPATTLERAAAASMKQAG
jgi:hypothetical protein